MVEGNEIERQVFVVVYFTSMRVTSVCGVEIMNGKLQRMKKWS
jgi:hypothetical protein